MQRGRDGLTIVVSHASQHRFGNGYALLRRRPWPASIVATVVGAFMAGRPRSKDAGRFCGTVRDGSLLSLEPSRNSGAAGVREGVPTLVGTPPHRTAWRASGAAGWLPKLRDGSLSRPLVQVHVSLAGGRVSRGASGQPEHPLAVSPAPKLGAGDDGVLSEQGLHACFKSALLKSVASPAAFIALGA